MMIENDIIRNETCLYLVGPTEIMAATATSGGRVPAATSGGRVPAEFTAAASHRDLCFDPPFGAGAKPYFS